MAKELVKKWTTVPAGLDKLLHEVEDSINKQFENDDVDNQIMSAALNGVLQAIETVRDAREQVLAQPDPKDADREGGAPEDRWPELKEAEKDAKTASAKETRDKKARAEKAKEKKAEAAKPAPNPEPKPDQSHSSFFGNERS